MTNPDKLRPEPVKSRSVANDRDALAASARTSRLIAAAAIVLALVAIGLAAWRVLAPADGSCQTKAWDVAPATEDLPDGWTVSASQYDIDRKNMSFLGAQPADETSNQPVIYATVTCFEQGASDAVTRSKAAAEAAGQSVVERDDLGEQAYSAVDDTGAIFVHLRSGPLVVYLAGSDASATEVDQVASAFDRALGGDGGTISSPTVPASGDLGAASDDPNASVPVDSGAPESPAAPDLVAVMPTKVGTVTLASDSALGSTILGEDQGSRAILAALRAAGKNADSMRVAQAYDESGASDLAFLVVNVDGMPVDQTQKLVMESWLSATGPGVTKTDVTLNGKPWTKIDYGDNGTFDFIRSEGANVIVVTTADQQLAEQAAAALP